MIKIIWMFRALFLKCFFGKFGIFSYMGKPCYISGVRRFFFGSRVRIYPNARIEALPSSTLIIEDNVSIGQCLHLICGGELTISSGTTISANVFISDISHSFEDVSKHVMDQPLEISPTFIGENSFIGYGAVILPGSSLGKSCIVGANSVVKGHFDDYCMLVGSPARVIKRYDLADGCWKKQI